MAVGHQRVVEALSTKLPPVSLFYGPRSVGKWTIAGEVLVHHGVHPKRMQTYESLTVEHARDIVEFCIDGVGISDGSKAVIARVDGASDASLNRLLKLLEEPPPGVHFVLIAATSPMLTVASRAQMYRFGYLSEEDITSILMAEYGVPLDRAVVAARRSGGQVSRAVDALRVEEAKGTVLSILKAAAEGNEDLFYNAVGGRRADKTEMFGVRQLDLLRCWATEARTGRWRMFSDAESFGLNLDPLIVERVLRVTARVDRPKVAVRAALLPVLWERSGRVALAG